MKIGPYTLDNNLILAPMAGVTDSPFRQLCRQMGAGLAVSEMITANSSLWASEKTLRRLNHVNERMPRSVQIVGNDPSQMANAARFNVDNGAQIIDINMGCPAKKVCNKAAGSALMRDEPLVARLLEAVVKAVDAPVTLKIRTGWDHDNRNALAIARIASESGIQALAVHGRTRADRFSGEAEYDTIAAVKQAITIPVIANGDIDSASKAKRVMELTGADALMIGRAAQGRPWIFREIGHYLATGEQLPELTSAQIHQLLHDHLVHLYTFYGEHTGVRIARKHIAWYTKGLRDSAPFRQEINRIESPDMQLHQINLFFERQRNDKELAA